MVHLFNVSENPVTQRQGNSKWESFQTKMCVYICISSTEIKSMFKLCLTVTPARLCGIVTLLRETVFPRTSKMSFLTLPWILRKYIKMLF